MSYSKLKTNAVNKGLDSKFILLRKGTLLLSEKKIFVSIFDQYEKEKWNYMIK